MLLKTRFFSPRKISVSEKNLVAQITFNPVVQAEQETGCNTNKIR